MSIVFTHDGRTFYLDTDGGEVHCAELAPVPAEPAPLEPSEDPA